MLKILFSSAVMFVNYYRSVWSAVAYEVAVFVFVCVYLKSYGVSKFIEFFYFSAHLLALGS